MLCATQGRFVLVRAKRLGRGSVFWDTLYICAYISCCYAIIKNAELSLAQRGSYDRQQEYVFPCGCSCQPMRNWQIFCRSSDWLMFTQSIYNKSQQILKISSSSLNAGTQASVSLVDGIVNHVLLQSGPDVNQLLSQLVHVLHFFLVDAILHHSTNLVIYWLEIWAIRRPQIR